MAGETLQACAAAVVDIRAYTHTYVRAFDASSVNLAGGTRARENYKNNINIQRDVYGKQLLGSLSYQTFLFHFRNLRRQSEGGVLICCLP